MGFPRKQLSTNNDNSVCFFFPVCVLWLLSLANYISQFYQDNYIVTVILHTFKNPNVLPEQPMSSLIKIKLSVE